MSKPFIRRVAAAACMATLGLAALAGCERRQPEVPTPSPSSPTTPSSGPATTPMPETGSASGPMGSTTPAFPPASAASQ